MSKIHRHRSLPEYLGSKFNQLLEIKDIETQCCRLINNYDHKQCRPGKFLALG